MYTLQKSSLKNKKWMVINPQGKRTHFGADGYSDYTKHHDIDRMHRYVKRHGGSSSGLTSSKENWRKSGIDTAGFWSRWILWNKPSLEASIRDTRQRFGVNIRKK